MNDFRDVFVFQDISILQAMESLDRASQQVLLVVDISNKLLGVITDGDIRRGILARVSLEEKVSRIMNKKPIWVSEALEDSEVAALMKTKGVSRVPVLDSQGRVVNLKKLEELVTGPMKKDSDVVIMAGGLGSRLGDLTANCPKPMLRIGDKPILELILENLISHGFSRFTIAVNYRGEMIEEYFADGKKWAVEIEYLHEPERLGTAGALSMYKTKNTQPILVTNADVITKVNFTSFLESHLRTKSMATMGVRKYDFQVPFGVVTVDRDNISAIEEKPVQSFFVNAGVYFLDPSILTLIPKGKAFDMPDLFSAAIKEKKPTKVFPIHEYWLDIGRPDDLAKAGFIS